MSPRRSLIACLAGAAALLGLTACGGSSSTQTTSRSTATPAAIDRQFASQTEQLCRQKRTAIAGLGYVHITYAGIARVGLPAVKRSLESYLDRLLAVLREFSQRQRQVPTPPAVASTMQMASQLDSQSQAATVRLRSAVARAKSAAELSAAFHVWTTALQGLSARGEALARQLKLPGCEAGSGTGRAKSAAPA